MSTSYEPHSIVRLPTGSQHELHEDVSCYIFSLIAENERLRGALNDLQDILCDPEGVPCFVGSDGDREVARQAFAALAGEEKPCTSEQK